MTLNLQKLLPTAPKPRIKKLRRKEPLVKKIAPKPQPKRIVLDKSPKPLTQKATKDNNITIAIPKSEPISLANSFMGFGAFEYTAMPIQTIKTIKVRSKKEKKIRRLYGKEFDSYTSTQKKYIRHNLNTIQKITQNTLSRNGYPETAVRTKQAGTNIVSFYLHPNGDISELKLKHRIGYVSLDKNTLKVIGIAYKDYPLPNQKTRLIFRVEYSLY